MSSEEREQENIVIPMPGQRPRMGELSENLFNERGGFPGGATDATYQSGSQVPPDISYQSGAPGRVVQPPLPPQYQGQGEINPENNPELFRAIRKQGFFATLPFSAGTTFSLLRPFEVRTYFFIQNLHGAQDLYVGFGFIPTANTGLTLTPGSAYEPWTVPVNEIYVVGQGAATTGILLYSTEPR